MQSSIQPSYICNSISYSTLQIDTIHASPQCSLKHTPNTHLLHLRPPTPLLIPNPQPHTNTPIPYPPPSKPSKPTPQPRPHHPLPPTPLHPTLFSLLNIHRQLPRPPHQPPINIPIPHPQRTAQTRIRKTPCIPQAYNLRHQFLQQFIDLRPNAFELRKRDVSVFEKPQSTKRGWVFDGGEREEGAQGVEDGLGGGVGAERGLEDEGFEDEELDVCSCGVDEGEHVLVPGLGVG